MARIRVFGAAFLGLGIALGLGPSSAVSQSSAAAPLKEIHVDRSCTVLPEESDALAELSEAELQNDHAICHLESVFRSQHVEEALREGVMQRNKVAVQEQEYLLQNVTSAPVVFVVEHVLPEDWQVDSDPQPVKVIENKAYFRAHAAPGQIVRLHVGERHAEPAAESE